MNHKIMMRALLISTLVAAAPAGPAFARGFGGRGGGGSRAGGFRGTGIGYHNGSFGGYGGYGGFRGGGFGPYGGFNGAGFGGYRTGSYGNYGNFGGMSSFARVPSFSPPHLITPGRLDGLDRGVRTGGVRYRGASLDSRPNIHETGAIGGLDDARVGAVGGRGVFGASAMRPLGFNAYGRYHGNWMHGYWNGNRNAAWGWRSPYWGFGGAGVGWGMGLGMGWGLPSWGYGSPLYGMGYMPYMNPYYSNAFVATSPYDYARPIDTTAAPVDEATANPAEALFDAGRAAFKQGNYDDALKQTDEALKQLPSDTTLHEFRGICLFALGRYDEAAATLYAVLSVGPGWDWTTLVGLYPSVDVYTTQLRTLEAYCRANKSAQAWFVLAYHYLTQGFTDAAVKTLKHVIQLNPSDALSTRLLKQLDAPQPDAVAASSPAEAAAPASLVDAVPPDGATINGTWTASPSNDVTVTLTIADDGAFSWRATSESQSQPRTFTGKSTFGDGLLTLVQDKGPAMVGRVSWTDAAHMTFRIVGDGPDDPGLKFSR